MKNKKGFTLVELMAVVIILIIVIFIAINKVNKSTKEARDKTIVANAGLYVKAVNGFISEKTINDDNYESGKLTVSQLGSQGVSISGTKPDSGYVVFSNSEVKYACLVYSGYNITYKEGDFSDITKDECEDLPISYNFTYKNKEEVFTVPLSGEYILEVWGGQGGSNSYTTGGYGGYSRGTITLKKGDKLYINVAGKGSNVSTDAPGYNGGGAANYGGTRGSGGGATSIATKSGLLSTLSEDIDKILIVAGGGGGAGYYNSGQCGNGGSAGGYLGSNGVQVSGDQGGAGYYGFGGSQTAGGASGNNASPAGLFGKGADRDSSSSYGGSGGGGGFYGGGASTNNGGAGGGSGYIGNEKLTDKDMYCYNCLPSSVESTKTNSVACAEVNPTPECAKKDTGYARITLAINDLSLVGTILDEYQQVSYIESSGSQYIDIDYKPKTNTKAVFDLSFSGEFKPYETYGGSPEFFGVSETDGTKSFYINFGEASNQGNQIYIWNDREYGINSAPVQTLDITNDIRTNRNLLTLENDKVTYGSVTRNIISKENNNISSMYVFGANSLFDTNYAGAFNSYNMRLYNLKIYEGSDLVHDYRPCYKDSNIGLCDITTNKFYANSGTGTFIKGNDI